MEREKDFSLRKLGLCGADDSISPSILGLLCQAYPFVEFGILFRPDKQGEPRYASKQWVEELARVASMSNDRMTFAAHLCGARVNEVLDGNDDFVATLYDLGFRRVQINATAVNGVDTSNLAGSVIQLATVIQKHSNLEFILQKNEETKPLWEGLLTNDNVHLCGPLGCLPGKTSMLLDESKGTGVLPTEWPQPPQDYNIGYAGGIGPKNIKTVLRKVMDVSGNKHVWIDMESSLRSNTNGKDVFDLSKCFICIEAVCEAGLYPHPSFVPT